MGKGERYRAQYPFLCGAVAGGIEICITYPLEGAKRVQQLNLHKEAGLGLLGTLRRTAAGADGVRGLYRGLAPWLFFAFPRSAVRFSVYEYSIRAAGEAGHSSSAAAACGFLAGVAESASVMTPMQNVQIKLMHDASGGKARRFRGFFHSLVEIPRRDGVLRGLYSGTAPTVLKGAVNNMIRFSVYERLKASIARSAGGDGTGVQLLSGAVAGGISAFVTHPCDTVMAHLMSFEGSRYRGAVDCFASLLRDGGPAALYKGIQPRVVRVCCEVALQFALFEQISRRVDALLARPPPRPLESTGYT